MGITQHILLSGFRNCHSFLVPGFLGPVAAPRSFSQTFPSAEKLGSIQSDYRQTVSWRKSSHGKVAVPITS